MKGKRYYHSDYALLFMTIMIALFGVLMIYSAGYYTALREGSQWRFVIGQLLGLGIGAFAMILVSTLDYQTLMKQMPHCRGNLVYDLSGSDRYADRCAVYRGRAQRSKEVAELGFCAVSAIGDLEDRSNFICRIYGTPQSCSTGPF